MSNVYVDDIIQDFRDFRNIKYARTKYLAYSGVGGRYKGWSQETL